MSQPRKQTAQQKLNNFLRSADAKTYPLNSYTRAVLAALASYFYYSDECWPSIPSICDYSQLDRRIVWESLSILNVLGLIPIIKKKGSKNIYQWRIPYIPDEEIYKKKTVNKSVQQKK
jgi:hypothetical protein